MADKLPSKPKPTLMYAIQRKSDGLWSRGGAGPKWGKLPKTWGIGPFKNHLLMYKINGYDINVEKAEELIATGATRRWRDIRPDCFTKHKLLHNQYFPYFDCEIVEFAPTTMEVTNRYPAEEWVWDNCYKPNYEKMGSYSDGRYLKRVKEYCEKYGKDFS